MILVAASNHFILRVGRTVHHLHLPLQSALARGRIVSGQVAEWFKATVLKTVVGGSSPWVRIPPCPPNYPPKTLGFPPKIGYIPSITASKTFRSLSLIFAQFPVVSVHTMGRKVRTNFWLYFWRHTGERQGYGGFEGNAS
jgi:hypothetical protein